MFVYHGVPRGMTGEILYPLNQLAAIDRTLYEFQKAKYVGREAALDFRIPGANVLWNDAVHCAPLHPYHLFVKRRSLGFDTPRPEGGWWPGLFFAIPLDRILVHTVIWYSWETLWINGAPDEDVPLTPPLEEFAPFDLGRYRELRDVTEAHACYLRRMKERGKRPLTFVHVPHVLVAGPIDVRGLRPIPWDEAPEWLGATPHPAGARHGRDTGVGELGQRARTPSRARHRI